MPSRISHHKMGHALVEEPACARLNRLLNAKELEPFVQAHSEFACERDGGGRLSITRLAGAVPSSASPSEPAGAWARQGRRSKKNEHGKRQPLQRQVHALRQGLLLKEPTIPFQLLHRSRFLQIFLQLRMGILRPQQALVVQVTLRPHQALLAHVFL